MTEPSVYITTQRKAEIAVTAEKGRKARLKAAEQVMAERKGEAVYRRTKDGLDLLLDMQSITLEQHAFGKRFQAAFENCGGLRGRNSLDMSPPGSIEDAWQAIIESGGLVAAMRGIAVTTAEKALLAYVVGLGWSVKAAMKKYQGWDNGRALDNASNAVSMMLQRGIDTRL